MPYQFTVTFGGHTFSSPGYLNIDVDNNLVGSRYDRYIVRGCSGGASCTGSTLELSLWDRNGTVFTSDALPLNAPPFSAFEIATFGFSSLLGD